MTDGDITAFDRGGLSPGEPKTRSSEDKKRSSPEEPKDVSGEEDETSSDIETKNPLVEAEGDGSELGARHVTYTLVGPETFRTPPKAGEQKVKVGFTFRKSVKERLDTFCTAMDAGDGPSVAKSEVAEAAVDLFLRIWEMFGQDSLVIKWLRKRAGNRSNGS